MFDDDSGERSPDYSGICQKLAQEMGTLWVDRCWDTIRHGPRRIGSSIREDSELENHRLGTIREICALHAGIGFRWV